MAVDFSHILGGKGAVVVKPPGDQANGRAYFVLTIEVEAQRIRAIRFIVNPDKLAHV